MADDPADPRDAASAAGEGTAQPEHEADGAPLPASHGVADERARSAPPSTRRAGSALRRALILGLSVFAPCSVILVSGFLILRGSAHRGTPPPSSSATNDAGPAALALAASAKNSPLLDKAEVPAPVFDEQGSDEAVSPHKRAIAKHFSTVQQAAAGSCSTESVDGLSRQIIDQARCIEPKAFVSLPKRANLVLSAHVFPYLELGAREHLMRALDLHVAETMTVNSVFRTVAQQYLVWRWAASKTCGVQLATPPGESNHEIGEALDIVEATKWRPALEAQEFHWLGASDRVHFDYKGGGGSTRTATDVLAFQKLWNRNHHEDQMPENGLYNLGTEQRLKKAPAGGFAIGPSCRLGSAHKH